MKRRKKRRQSPERESRRGEIIAAAIRLFAERGIENVTYGDIARETRLSRPLIYFYFPDAQTLIIEALIVSSAELRRRFTAAVKPARSGLEQIMAIGRAYVTFASEEPALFEILAHNETKQPKEHWEHPLMKDCLCHSDAIMGSLISALQKGVRDGSIRKDIGDPDKVAICLWGLTHGLIHLDATKQPFFEATTGSTIPKLPELGLDLIRRSLRAAK